MDVIPNTYIPGDSRLVQQLVYELKSQGIFDQFRKECIADVDTKPAYQNLRQRVEGSVSAFLKEQKWSADMNKNQVREQLRKNIYESGYLDTGVERVVDQVVNPKINTVLFPQVEDVVYRYLGLEKPSKEVKKDTVITDLLPTDLEAVSPESVHSFTPENEKREEIDLNDSQNNSINSKVDEDESPPFEPLENIPNKETVILPQEENSGDSQLSGFSGLQSHESSHANDNTCQNGSQMDWSFQDSQDLSQNSFDSRQSLGNSDTKMEICEDSESKSLKSNDTNSKIENGSKMYMEDSMDNDQSMDNLIIDETEEINKSKEIVSDIKKVDDNKSKNEKKSEEKRSKDKKDDDKKRSEDKKSKNSDKYTSKDKKEEKYKKDDKYSSSSKDRDRSSSKHSSSSKDRSNTSSSTSSRDKEKSKDDKDGKEKISVPSKEKNKDSKDYKNDAEKGKADKDKYKTEKDKSKDKYKEKEKGKGEDKSVKEKEKLSKKDKDKSEKNKVYKDKDKTDNKDKYKDKTDKNKDKSEKKKKEEKSDSSKDRSRERNDKETKKSEKEKSDKDKMDRHKEKTEHKDKDKGDKDKSKSSSSKSSTKDKDRDSKNLSSSSSSKKESSSSTKRKEKSDSSSSKSEVDSEAKTKKDKHEKHGDTPSPKKSKRDPKKEPKDDHYSFKDKKNDRRSFDRDSNDGHSSKKSQNCSTSFSERTQQDSSSSSSFSGSGSGDSRNSDGVEKTSVNNIDSTENQESAITNDVQTFKYIKPKFASNFEEARKIMKIRKQLALLEKQNKLSLAQVELATPLENGNAETEYKQNVNMIDMENRNLKINLFKEVIQEVTNSDKENTDNSVEKSKSSEKKGPVSPKILPEKKIVANIPENSKPVVDIPLALSPKKTISLQTTNLSKENWEALEARLAEEMSNLDYGSYASHYDDYDDIGYTPVVVSPRKNVVLTLSEDVKRKNSDIKEASDTVNNKEEKDVQVNCNEDISNKISSEDKNIKESSNGKVKKSGDIKNEQQTEIIESSVEEKAKYQQELDEVNECNEEIEENVPEVVENLVNNEIVEELVNDTETTEVPVESCVEEVVEMDNQFNKDEDIAEITEVTVDDHEKETNCNTNELCVTLEEIHSQEYEQLKQDNDITVIEVANTEIMMSDINEDQLKPVTANIIIINKEESTRDVENDDSDDCRYLEKPEPAVQRKIKYISKYILKLKNHIQREIQSSDKNVLPVKRGRKRKINENVDIKNNNETSFNQTVLEVKRPRGRPPKANSDVSNSSKDKSCNSSDIPPQNFSFPLSPAESEKSFDKKEEEINPAKAPKQKKGARKTPVSKRLQQRYASEDLYKPRPSLGLSSRRSRGAKDS